uniref:Uncharacterized protein n=1 Tax=Prevotella sp. GTC17262 TaxID=3236797 RepID=A0AB33JJ53_9BACT
MKRLYVTPLCEIVRVCESEAIMEEHMHIGSADADTSGEAKRYFWFDNDDVDESPSSEQL